MEASLVYRVVYRYRVSSRIPRATWISSISKKKKRQNQAKEKNLLQ